MFRACCLFNMEVILGTEAKKLVLKFSSFSSGAASRLPMMGCRRKSVSARDVFTSDRHAHPTLLHLSTPSPFPLPSTPLQPLQPPFHKPSKTYSVSRQPWGQEQTIQLRFSDKFYESGKFQPRKRTHCLNLQFRLHWFGFLGETGSGSEVSQEETWRQAGFKSC